MPNTINIKIKEINFCDKKPFTIALSSNSIINVELWLEDYKFLNIVGYLYIKVPKATSDLKVA